MLIASAYTRPDHTQTILYYYNAYLCQPLLGRYWFSYWLHKHAVRLDLIWSAHVPLGYECAKIIHCRSKPGSAYISNRVEGPGLLLYPAHTTDHRELYQWWCSNSTMKVRHLEGVSTNNACDVFLYRSSGRVGACHTAPHSVSLLRSSRLWDTSCCSGCSVGVFLVQHFVVLACCVL